NIYKKKFISYAFSDEEARAQMVKYVFENQSKPPKLHGYKVAFIDSEGRKYYIPESELEFGIGRLSVFQRYYDFLAAGVSRDNILMVTSLLNSTFNKLRQGFTLDLVKDGERATEALESMAQTPL